MAYCHIRQYQGLSQSNVSLCLHQFRKPPPLFFFFFFLNDRANPHFHSWGRGGGGYFSPPEDCFSQQQWWRGGGRLQGGITTVRHCSDIMNQDCIRCIPEDPFLLEPTGQHVCILTISDSKQQQKMFCTDIDRTNTRL